MSASAQNGVNTWYKHVLPNHDFDPAAFFAQLDRTYVDPNAAKRARGELISKPQGDQPFALFLPKFEKLLHEARVVDDQSAQTYLLNAINNEMKSALVSCEDASSYPDLVNQLFRVGSKLEELKRCNRRPYNAALQFPAPAPAPTQTKWTGLPGLSSLRGVDRPRPHSSIGRRGSNALPTPNGHA